MHYRLIVSLIFFKFQIDVDLRSLKLNTNAAHIISVGPVHSSQRLFLAADKEILVRVADVLDAFILFLMMHYIFWLEYPAYCKCTCKFLQQQVLKRNAAEDGPVPVKLIRFMDKLDSD